MFRSPDATRLMAVHESIKTKIKFHFVISCGGNRNVFLKNVAVQMFN